MTTPPSARKHDYSQTIYHQDSPIQDEINDRSPPARDHHWDDPSNVMSTDRGKRRERPPALAIGTSLNGMDRLGERDHRDQDIEREKERARGKYSQPSLHISQPTPPRPSESSTRSPSSASSAALDPYYFTFPSRNPSPAPLPSAPKTPDADLFSNGTHHHYEPHTPARDPSVIDRRGLIGVGELATPRWATSQSSFHKKEWEGKGQVVQEEVELEREPEDMQATNSWSGDVIEHAHIHYAAAAERDLQEHDLISFSPAILPVDGAVSLRHATKGARALRHQPSATSESGGEEILYKPPMPRKSSSQTTKKGLDSDPSMHVSVAALRAPLLAHQSNSSGNQGGVLVDSTSLNSPIPHGAAAIPPSAYGNAPTGHRAKKRTSDEFAMDQAGTLTSKLSSAGLPSSDRERDEKYVRRHRSLGVGVPSVTKEREREKARDKRRGESIALTSSSSGAKASPPSAGSQRDRHQRHVSASSPSLNYDPTALGHGPSPIQRRIHTTDFSNYPPSPSASSIHQFLKAAVAPPTPPLPAIHSSPSVAHSLLRGTQEGWAGMDDPSASEALRKLDGMPPKSKTRSSAGSIGSKAGSRPGTPGAKSSSGQWEGREVSRDKARMSVGSKDHLARTSSSSLKNQLEAAEPVGDIGDLVLSGGEDLVWSPMSHASSHVNRKSINGKEIMGPGSRASYGIVPKRGSASSTNFTGTPTSGSRDSTTLSTTTSNTSVSLSYRHSYGKMRRNSAGSDISSVHSGDAAAAHHRDHGEEDPNQRIPPVPPLPKDLSSYRSPLPSSGSGGFPHSHAPEDPDRTVIIPSIDVPVASPKQLHPEKVPSKKWSFSALSLKLPSGSGSNKDHRQAVSPASPAGSPRSSRSIAYAAAQSQGDMSSAGEQTSSSSKHYSSSSKNSDPWSPQLTSPEAHYPNNGEFGAMYMSPAMTSTSISSKSPERRSLAAARTPDRSVHSRTETASSASTHTTAAPPTTSKTPLSPKRASSSKRLTPSSIPFFRRSTSQTMQVPPPPSIGSSSPTQLVYHAPSTSASSGSGVFREPSPQSSSNVPKKQSMLSLLKSGSRKSLHVDKPIDVKPKEKKDEKDRSESRISVLMGRKRGKTLSSTDPKKPKEAVPLPPMQITAIPSSTAQRVASLRTVPSNITTPIKSSSSRTSASPASNLSKASDASLRTSRSHLPTIAGSPSVGPVTMSSQFVPQVFPPPTSGNMLPPGSMNTKDTPTKIPRIGSRTSTNNSPQSTFKGASIMSSSRRTSLNMSSLSNISNTTEMPPSPQQSFASDFGVLDSTESVNKMSMPPPSASRNSTMRSSPQSISRVPRQIQSTISVPSSLSKKAGNRDSVSYGGGLRKSSTASVASLNSTITNESQTLSVAGPSTLSSRLSALSPSKSIKMLSPKMSLPAPRILSQSATSPALGASSSTPSSGRQSISTPSPVPSTVDDEELLGDEEMMQYIKRQQARKLANGARIEDLEEMLKFPEPLPPVPPSSPQALLRSSQAVYLSDFERKEILDYPAVYYIGARSAKKQATRDNSTNNHGYDDERGDYQVINHDHLAYRYEVIDTLGKGSFGQVLQCRDHLSGHSVAIKIIRNKKRFHHQALVEIKILDNLRKWDPDEKHYVIKMTEHFYFRNHLCIAMELLSINLYELIKANGFVGFTTTLIRRFTSQMLSSLVLMRHHRIVHCDLKPENILLRHPAKSAIKVIDFGSSCLEHEKVYTYIQSRFYRSPEVILGMSYNMAIDMWSLGCILAELYTGYPIFPGENEQEQLSCIMEVLGVPDKELINRSSRKKLFFDSTGAPRPVVNSKGRRRRAGSKTLEQVLRCDDENFIDFIAKCLVWDPERRLKPGPALRHPFLVAGRRPKVLSPPPSSSRGLLASTSASLSSRSSKVHETPKKSQIGAPTPLTARLSSRTTASTAIPSTPIATSSTSSITASSARAYRTSTAGNGSYHHSPRSVATTNGYVVSATKTS